MTATRELAAFASALDLGDVPVPVIEHAKLAVLDLLGCALYGATRPWTTLVHDYTESEGARGVSAVWGTRARTSPSLAALANGTAAHAAEIDDLHRASFYHPGAATVPAALAVADSLDGVGGRTLLAGIIAGYEVGTRVGIALGQGHFLAGYHPQGTVGVFGAAAASGHLLNLDAERMTHALGIAGTQASGLMAAQEGSMVKRMHAGLACQTGVRGSALAAIGFTGIEDVFEAEFGGLLGTLGTPASDRASLTEGLGTLWHTARIEFKRHAACAAIHTSLDVVEDLRSAHHLSAADVTGVRIRSTTHAFLHCGFPYRPAGVTAAQMSFQYCVAAMLSYGTVGVAQFDESLLDDPALVELAGRVEIVAAPELDALGADRRHAVEVEISTAAGVFRGDRVQRKGGADEPLPAAAIIAKFTELAERVMTPARAGKLAQTVLALETQADLRGLTDLLRAPSTNQER
jgi:2-methylcitrate dehydratase PrpD